MAIYMGLMSGTSMDAVDAVLADFNDRECQPIAYRQFPLPPAVKAQLLATRSPQVAISVREYGELDQELGYLFAEAANQLIQVSGLTAREVLAIGSHGQTLLHHPDGAHPFTLQAADPNIIAARTGITTVADFRRMDMAVAGQGAPLTPAFHAHMFRQPDQDRAVLNIGGIANLTLLPAAGSRPVIGFDCGPGNALLDDWILQHKGLSFDRDGQWAISGIASVELLDVLLQDDYFQRPPPKSTGRDYFNRDWLQRQLQHIDGRLRPEDVQATLLDLSCSSIADALKALLPGCGKLLVCGGGARNPALMEGLSARLPDMLICTTMKFGLDPDSIEALAFAWLAKRRLDGLPGNMPSVTGADREAVLGGIYAG